ncbi:MAG: hypothetical protein M1822_003681 [Bathelium mastoideum]|nr:MAG: hypothetical protein M1822_003681 [Bathelium mastoideum]
MPSPACLAPITLAGESEWFIPVEGDEGIAHLPLSIPPGFSATSEGSIKVFIRERRDTEIQPVGEIFRQQAEVHIKARWPWIGKELPDFELTKTIDIRYPCSLRGLGNLETVAQGSHNVLKVEVSNYGETSVGPTSRLPRPIEIQILFPSEFGGVEDEAGEWRDSVVIPLQSIPARKTVAVQHKIRINEDARPYERPRARVRLFLGKPSRTVEEGLEELVLIHEEEILMQVSDLHQFQGTANFLLATNTATDGRRIESIRQFIREQLHMELDIWNVGLYGGFQSWSHEKGQLHHVLDRYIGKSIIVLCSESDFFRRGSRSITNLCDPVAFASHVASGANCLFLDAANLAFFDDLSTFSIFRLCHSLTEIDNHVFGPERFENIEQLVEAVREERQYTKQRKPQRPKNYVLPLRRRWYDLPGTPTSEARTGRPEIDFI